MIAATEGFAPLRAALDRAGVRYAIGGSWASTAHGEPRFTNDVDVLADLHHGNLQQFLNCLPGTFFADAEEARSTIDTGRPFNVIYMPIALKFDLFPANAFPLGQQELDRAVWLSGTGISDEAAPFVTPEDILLAKLNWFRAGGEVCEVQWRDIQGLLHRVAEMDFEYLEQSARTLNLQNLLHKARAQASQ